MTAMGGQMTWSSVPPGWCLRPDAAASRGVV
jgi:hypothetical protein